MAPSGDIFDVRTPQIRGDLMQRDTVETPEVPIPVLVTGEGTSFKDRPQDSSLEEVIETSSSNKSRLLGAIFIFLSVAILITAELVSEPQSSLHARNIRYILLAGELVSLAIVTYVTYVCTGPGNCSSVNSLYLLVLFSIVLLLLSVSHRVGYGLSIFVSVLAVVLSFGIAGLTRNWLMVIPILLSLSWLIYLVLNPPPGEAIL